MTSNPQWPPRSPHEALLSSPSGRRRMREERASPSPSPLKSIGQKMGQISEDEDEETLQLRLEALEARLKLKKLQKKRTKTSEGSKAGTLKLRPEPYKDSIQVAVSPPKRALKEFLPGVLGIDKGLKGKDVSLRRPPGSDPLQPDTLSKPKSFSQRIAESRQQDKESKERQNRLQRKSTGFGVPQQDLDALRAASVKEPEYSSETCRGFSRDEVLRAVKPGGLRNTVSARRRKVSPVTTTSTESFESFSSTHLSKRLIPHPFLANTLAQKHISLIPSLLATIKSPIYTLPEALENDFVVFGIIASKSSPLTHKDGHKTTETATTSLSEATDSEMNARGKFMVFSLTDLKWTLDLYLFTTAYTRFWKLTPGTLIAILNPSIMPPPRSRADTGRFSLALNSSDDTILEVGTSRDLGWCKSVKRDGKTCGSWVDKRHTEFCEWHVDRVVETTRRARMEVNGMSAPYAPGGKSRGRIGFWESGGVKEGKGGKEGGQWDRETGSRYFIGPGNATADEGFERGKEERIRKRLAERQREKEIARQLGQGGNGMGGEYLRLRHEASSTQHVPSKAETDAATLGLLGNKAGDVHLSPLKRKMGAGEGTGTRKKTRFVTAKGIRDAGESVTMVDDELDII